MKINEFFIKIIKDNTSNFSFFITIVFITIIWHESFTFKIAKIISEILNT